MDKSGAIYTSTLSSIAQNRTTDINSPGLLSCPGRCALLGVPNRCSWASYMVASRVPGQESRGVVQRNCTYTKLAFVELVIWIVDGIKGKSYNNWLNYAQELLNRNTHRHILVKYPSFPLSFHTYQTHSIVWKLPSSTSVSSTLHSSHILLPIKLVYAGPKLTLPSISRCNPYQSNNKIFHRTKTKP